MIKDINCIILAGGASSRMGTNKALLAIDNQAIISIMVNKLKNIFNSIIIVSNNPQLFDISGVRFVEDKYKHSGKSSLMGIYSGLMEADSHHSFLLPCDMPFVNSDLIQYMISKIEESSIDVLIPYIDGYYQPLHSIYSKNCIMPMKNLMDNNRYKIIDAFPQLNVKTVSKEEVLKYDKEQLCFLNLNTPEDYRNAVEIWREKHENS